MTRSRITLAALVAAAVTLPALAAFHLWRPAPSPRAAASASAAPSPGLRGTDAAWLSLMIAMNESTLILLERASTRVTDPHLATFVTTLVASHRAELAELLGIANRQNVLITNEHEGHELPGIVTPADLARIEASAGTAFDDAVRECLREHLEQGARLAGSEQRAGKDDETRRFAVRIEQARKADLARM
ncbi:DUF305 domain-containing protein [Virgisporangium aurantiacum]|uniref:DUF305 domain-containing protein n=1 Tax=Virgisporangium aurantiacum TaxID=175570 RepID=A0A8J3ZAK8_9ACTN|nr:DUF305 domain-containing protein [Virgisporangium aurantiacum]GIJ57803.1 hypothetical protein Vau01_053190 [Virgisporangium aurantiacum]